MSHLRHDRILGHWVIIAPERAARPIELVEVEAGPRRTSCAFCEGHEAATPGEVWALRDAGTQHDSPGWRVRVVPNKFPAVAATAEEDVDLPAVDLPYQAASGWGVHEVIVESPRHVLMMSELDRQAVCDILTVYRQRLAALSSDRRIAHAIIFKNVGSAAGASLEHVHSQLLALPQVPRAVAGELAAAADYFRTQACCPFCAVIERELGEDSARSRIVLESSNFVAFCPYAARTPYEVWVMPRTHECHFHQIADHNLSELAAVLRETVVRVEHILSQPAYNYLLHTAPFDMPALEYYHWHIEVVPRVTKFAGFELASGYYVNPVPPEQAARVLRASDRH